MNENRRTLASYDTAADRYESFDQPVPDFLTVWLDKSLAHLPRTTSILEIGTATGRDAAYIEQRGFTVERTDASTGLIERARANGIEVRHLDVLTGPIDGLYGVIYAGAVLHHFTIEQLRTVLRRLLAALDKSGQLVFTTKHGRGEEWETAKLGRERYFRYWESDDLCDELRRAGFGAVEVDSETADGGQAWLLVSATKS